YCHATSVISFMEALDSLGTLAVGLFKDTKSNNLQEARITYGILQFLTVDSIGEFLGHNLTAPHDSLDNIIGG
ncbi:hypothetical protein ACJX0J_023927, partial [Zea mays]